MPALPRPVRSIRWLPTMRLRAILTATALPACAGVLGIEEAECDPSFDVRCSQQTVLPLGGEANAGQGGSATAQAGGMATGNGGTPDDGVEGSDEPDEPVPQVDLCTRYCQSVLANCTEELTVYASEDACMSVCAILESGAPGDAASNTVECRLARAELAGTTGEPSDYCYSAGPGGGGVCGSDCEGYCDLMNASCAEFDSRADCLNACAGVPVANGLFNIELGDFGDSIQCRLFHASAATLDPVVHCEHAAGRAVCVGPPPAPML